MAEMGGMTWEAGPGRGGEAEAGPQQSSGGFWDGEWGGGTSKRPTFSRTLVSMSNMKILT